jgi:hypothetical protein
VRGEESGTPSGGFMGVWHGGKSFKLVDRRPHRRGRHTDPLVSRRRLGGRDPSVVGAIDPLPRAMLWTAARGSDPERRWLRDRLRPIVRSRFTKLADKVGSVELSRRLISR